PDLCGGLRIDLAARQGTKAGPDENHRMPALALRLVDPKNKTSRSGFGPQFRDEPIPLVHPHVPNRRTTFGQKCPNVNVRVTPPAGSGGRSPPGGGRGSADRR